MEFWAGLHAIWIKGSRGSWAAVDRNGWSSAMLFHLGELLVDILVRLGLIFEDNKTQT